MLNITPIINNVIIALDFDADLDKNQFVWRGLENGFQDYEIYFFDGTNTIQITNNQIDDFAPKLSNGQILWHQYNENDSEIFLYDGTKTIQITDNKVDDSNAQFYGSQIVWESLDPVEKGGDYEILLYNNGQTQQLTDNQTDNSLKIVEGNYILWTSFNRITDQEALFLYNGITSLELTANSTDYYPSFDTDGQNVVWLNKNEVYLYDGNTTKQITSNGLTKTLVQVSGNKIVWLGNDSSTGYDNEVFLHDGNTTTQLTNNNLNENNLLVDGENIVWQVDNFDYINYTSNNDIYI